MNIIKIRVLEWFHKLLNGQTINRRCSECLNDMLYHRNYHYGLCETHLKELGLNDPNTFESLWAYINHNYSRCPLISSDRAEEIAEAILKIPRPSEKDFRGQFFVCMLSLKNPELIERLYKEVSPFVSSVAIDFLIYNLYTPDHIRKEVEALRKEQKEKHWVYTPDMPNLNLNHSDQLMRARAKLKKKLKITW